MSAERTRARVFGEAAELYERRRPGYPPQLYDDLLALVDPRRRALEAGAGTGKATVELARRGLELVAFEPDPAMAALAGRAVQGLPAQIVGRQFEDWNGADGTFDLVVSAQAWHWLDPDRSAAVARRALRAGGVLAAWWNQAGDSQGPVREAIDAVYDRHAPDLRSSVINRPLHQLGPESLAIEGFELMEPRTYTWAQRYDAESYAELLQTHSDHRLLAPQQLNALVTAISDVIDQLGDGQLIYPYRTDLFTARRKRASY